MLLNISLFSRLLSHHPPVLALFAFISQPVEKPIEAEELKMFSLHFNSFINI